jgi:hypothetical protein
MKLLVIVLLLITIASCAEIYYDVPGKYTIDKSVYGNAKKIIVELWGAGGSSSQDCGS